LSALILQAFHLRYLSSPYVVLELIFDAVETELMATGELVSITLRIVEVADVAERSINDVLFYILL